MKIVLQQSQLDAEELKAGKDGDLTVVPRFFGRGKGDSRFLTIRVLSDKGTLLDVGILSVSGADGTLSLGTRKSAVPAGVDADESGPQPPSP